ncbi:MAG TPA: hypothetical protein VMN36_13790 [Verrucomicrobiales bacterium]|nr:hypothetical protein [Verrucomicrobiales bacterium]
MNKLEAEKELRQETESRLAARQSDLAQEKDTLAATKTQLEQVTGNVSEFKELNDALDSEISAVDDRLIDVDDEIADLDKEIARINKAIDDAGDPKVQIAELQEWQQKVNASEGTLRSLSSQLTSAESSQGALESQINSLQTLFERRRLKQFAAPFFGRIQDVYPQWGFVVLDSGGAGGVVLGAELSVVRGGEQIATLRVTNVERGRSVADIVPGSLAEGQTLAPGDRVVGIVKPEEETATQ